MSTQTRGTQLNYELPNTIRSLKDGWMSTCQNSAVVSALFAGVASQFYSTLTDPKNYTQRSFPHGAFTFEVLLCYSSVIFNASAAISSFILGDYLSEVHIRAAQREEPYAPNARVFADQFYLLKKYGGDNLSYFVFLHWLFCYFAGLWSLIMQLLTYAIMREPDNVRIPVACLSGFAVLPLIVFIIPSRTMSDLNPHTWGPCNKGLESDPNLQSNSTLTAVV